MDYKFWLPFGATVLGLGFQIWQIRLMRNEINQLPSTRSPRRVTLERALLRKLYTPVFVMFGLVLLSWLPFIISAAKPTTLPVFLAGWGGALDGCNAAIDTSSFRKASDKYRMFLVCRILDPTVDELEDDKIAVSKPFQITGGMVSILIPYGPSDPIKSVARVGSQTAVSIFLLPKDDDGSRVRKLSDVSREGGQILIQGGTLKD